MPRRESFIRDYAWIIILAECVAYAFLWVWNQYVAVYLTLIFPALLMFVLTLSWIADLIEPSRISRWYYFLIGISILVPIGIGGIFYFINGGFPDFSL